MSRKYKRIIVAILAVMMILSTLASAAISVMAAESMGIGISYHTGSENISGAVFSVVKVASAKKEGGGYVYTKEEQFSDMDVNPNGITDAKEAAQKAKAYYKTGADTVITNNNGYCFVGIDEPGLYLVWQTDSAGKAKEYNTASPILAFVPSFNKDDSTWNNTVSIEPKTSHKNTTSNDNDDSSDGESDSSYGAVSVYKVDAEDKSIHLEGAVFSLYKSNGSKVGTYTTNKDGYFGVPYLAYGNYYIIEDKAPDGYVCSNNKISFAINKNTSYSNNYPWIIMVTNTRKTEAPAEPANDIAQDAGDSSSSTVITTWATGDTGNIILWAIVVATCTVGIVFVSKRRSN